MNLPAVTEPSRPDRRRRGRGRLAITGAVALSVALVVLPSGPVGAQDRSRPNLGPSLPVRAFPGSVFNVPARAPGMGVLTLPPTPPAPRPKKVAVPKVRPAYARVVKKPVTKVARPKTKKKKGAATTVPTETTVAAVTPPVDPIATSSGACAGVNGVDLATKFQVSFALEPVDPSGWCQLLAGDANRIVRFSPDARIDWPSLALNSYFTVRASGIGRDAIRHDDQAASWSEYAVLLPGGRLFIASSIRSADDAKALAETVADLAPPIDAVGASVGDCPGPLTAKALAGVGKQVFRNDGSLEADKRCLLVSEDGLIQVSVARDPVAETSALRVDGTYWKEYEGGVGRSAVYHPPAGPEDLHGVGFLVKQWDLDVFTSSREQSRALALEIVKILGP